jgi:hypothetical protein
MGPYPLGGPISESISSPKRVTVNLDSPSAKFLEDESEGLGLSVSAYVRLLVHALFSIKVEGNETLPDLRHKIEEYMTFHSSEYRGK